MTDAKLAKAFRPPEMDQMPRDYLDFEVTLQAIMKKYESDVYSPSVGGKTLMPEGFLAVGGYVTNMQTLILETYYDKYAPWPAWEPHGPSAYGMRLLNWYVKSPGDMPRPEKIRKSRNGGYNGVKLVKLPLCLNDRASTNELVAADLQEARVWSLLLQDFADRAKQQDAYP